VVYWIDHCVVCTNDVARWEAFFTNLLEGRTRPERLEVRQRRGIFVDAENAHVGGFIATAPLPPMRPLGEGLPRYGFFLDPDDVETYVKRLDELGAPHTDPTHTNAFGEPGVLVAWQDPDGNQFEFWAPEQLPVGAMAGGGHVGRISHGVFESRELRRTATLFERYCGVERDTRSSSEARLVLRLGGGGCLVFERVAALAGRTAGYGLPDPHTALLVHRDDFVASYERLWAGLPEFEHDIRSHGPIERPDDLAPCTLLHVSPAGRRCKELTGRGDDWFDWDTNLFHFYAGEPADERFSSYTAQPIDSFLDELKAGP
jgi:predicted enzyme related to lactoylglutathione lyase